MSELDQKEDLSAIQRHKQRVSKEAARASKVLKIDEKSIQYFLNGNKILKTFKKTNGNTYTVFVGQKEEAVKDSTTGQKVHSQAYLDLKKKGLIR